MNSREFRNIRDRLDKTQIQLARILCVSAKAVQSFEQRWRRVPTYIERQMLFLSSLKRSQKSGSRTCWEIKKCPGEWRENCIAWELKAGHFCWFINGTFCNGRSHDSWGRKMGLCRKCIVFQSMVEDSNRPSANGARPRPPRANDPRGTKPPTHRRKEA